MSIEFAAPHDRQPDIDNLFEEDGIEDFLGEEGFDWESIKSLDYRNLPEEDPVSAEKALQKNYSEIPVIAGDEMFEALKTAEIPAIEPLDNMSQDDAELLEQQISDARGVSMARRATRALILKNMENLNIDEVVLDEAILAISELLTNALVHGHGVRRIIVGKTPYNNLFFGAENERAEDVSDVDTVTHALGNAALHLQVPEDEIAVDEHKRGLFLIAACSVNGVQTDTYSGLKKDRTISAGISTLPVTALEKIASFDTVSDEDLHLVTNDGRFKPTRTLAWAAFGLDSEAARQADSLTIAS